MKIKRILQRKTIIKASNHMLSFILLQGRGDHWVSRAEIKSVESHERRQLLYIYNTVPAEHINMGRVGICKKILFANTTYVLHTLTLIK